MSDPTGDAAETRDFGVGGSAATGADATEAPADTSHDERPSPPAAAGDEGGTAYKAPQIDRPPPGDEPLSVRLASEE